jgi:hypothetical protein
VTAPPYLNRSPWHSRRDHAADTVTAAMERQAAKRIAPPSTTRIRGDNVTTDEFSSYLGLAELIARLELEDPTRILPIGFAEPHSFRGIYTDLAFEPRRDIAIGDMLTAARSALGTTYEGYKGGEYTMREHADCWIANHGEGGDNKLGPLLLELLLAQPAADHHARLAAGTEEG